MVHPIFFAIGVYGGFIQAGVGVLLVLALLVARPVNLVGANAEKILLSLVFTVPALLILMVVKFAIVVAYFMHLKFDDSLFTKLFVTGLVLALLVYGAFLTTLVFWGDPSGSRVQDLGALGFI